MEFQRKDHYNIDDLLEIMKILRSPEGCPWDREQTHESIRQNFIEETYEAIEAIDTKDTELLKEELGDVLMQVVFHALMEEEAGKFDFFRCGGRCLPQADYPPSPCVWKCGGCGLRSGIKKLGCNQNGDQGAEDPKRGYGQRFEGFACVNAQPKGSKRKLRRPVLTGRIFPALWIRFLRKLKN